MRRQYITFIAVYSNDRSRIYIDAPLSKRDASLPRYDRARSLIQLSNYILNACFSVSYRLTDEYSIATADVGSSPIFSGLSPIWSLSYSKCLVFKSITLCPCSRSPSTSREPLRASKHITYSKYPHISR